MESSLCTSESPCLTSEGQAGITSQEVGGLAKDNSLQRRLAVSGGCQHSQQWGMRASAACGGDLGHQVEVTSTSSQGERGKDPFLRWRTCSVDLSPVFLSLAKRPGRAEELIRVLQTSDEPGPVSPWALGRSSDRRMGLALYHSLRVSRCPSGTVGLTFPALPGTWVLPSSKLSPHLTTDRAGSLSPERILVSEGFVLF